MTARTACQFEIAIATDHQPMFYEYAQITAMADRLPSTAWRLRLAAADVARYRVEKSTSPRVELELTPAASARLRGDRGFGSSLHSAYFDVRLNGERQYVAIGWARIGAAAIRAPVVHAEAKEDLLVLRVGAQQGAWYMWGSFGKDDSRVDSTALRTCFESLGKLERVARLDVGAGVK